MHVLTQLSVPSNFEKHKRTVRLLGPIRYIFFLNVNQEIYFPSPSKLTKFQGPRSIVTKISCS